MISSHPVILVVDDDDDARAMLGDAFDQAGATVLLTPTADMALDVVASIMPDAVVTDLHLPRRPHGVRRVLHEIRRQQGQRVLIFALSGEMTEHDRATIQAAGFDGFFPKPFDPVALAREVLARVLNAQDRS